MNVSDLKFDFLPSTIFQLWSQIQENSISSYDFLKHVIPVKGGHYDHSPQSPKKLNYATGHN
jgi:hypothetical protein